MDNPQESYAHSPQFKLWKNSLSLMRTYNLHMSADEMKEIDQELAKAQAHISFFLNDGAPIHRLPPELLIKIFYYVPASSIGRDTVVWAPNVFKIQDIVALCSVCQRWRKIIFNAYILWSSINRLVGYPSSRLPPSVILNIKLEPEAQDRQLLAFRNFLTSTIARTRELHIVNRSAAGVRFPLDQGLAEAPALEVLSIVGSSVAPQFFETPIPQLRTLFLSRCVGLPTGPLPQLTQLALCSIGRVEISQVLSLLSAAPALQDLYLAKCLQQSNGDVVDNVASPVPLKHLRRVFIEEEEPHLVTLLVSSMALEPFAAIRIHYTFTTQLHLSTSRFSHSLLPITEQVSEFSFIPRAQSFRMIATSSVSGFLLDWTSVFGLHQPLPSSWFTELFPGARPRRVSLLHTGYPGKNFPSGMLRGLPESVETLSTSAIFLPCLAKDLAFRDETSRAPCPNLSTLRILMNRVCKKHRMRPFPLSKVAPAIVEVLNLRAQLGHPIRKVIIGFYNDRNNEGLKLHGINSVKRAVEYLEFASYTNIPFMKLPSVCAREDGKWWPSWTYALDGGGKKYQGSPFWTPTTNELIAEEAEPNASSDSDNGPGSE
ncbi:hypothetical protein OBBRIDRAFT_890574 [Obba rivulosa]|uniref:F-box domain-containing protein n=1 Tax=Obba rivulosa TaxID=1052685 RepID=A0A8E2AKN9_9APHY|nr:hypothetical protein OBBRIDRAFT_890574 [Obba rivulosa]